MDSVGKFAKIMNYGKSLFQNLRRIHPLWASALAAQLVKSGNSTADTAQHIEAVLKTLASQPGKSYNIAISSTSQAAPVVSPMIKLKNINPNTPILDMSNVKISESDIKPNGVVSATVLRRKRKPGVKSGSGKGSSW